MNLKILYPTRISYREPDEREEPPLALTQLKGILSSDMVRETGFVVAFRDHILPMMQHKLTLKDFDKFVVYPQTLNDEHFNELIELRYKTWKNKPIKFQQPVIKKVTSITNYNTRHTIQYFRALYQEAFDKGRKTVSLKTLEDIGKIPLFLY